MEDAGAVPRTANKASSLDHNLVHLQVLCADSAATDDFIEVDDKVGTCIHAFTAVQWQS